MGHHVLEVWSIHNCVLACGCTKISDSGATTGTPTATPAFSNAGDDLDSEFQAERERE